MKHLSYCILITLFINIGCKSTQQTATEFSKTPLTKTLIKPPYLKAGDSVVILSPAGILLNKQAQIEQAKKLLKSWGLNPILGENIFNQNNQFAGTDQERTSDFQKALDNKNIKAIWCSRGGYGSVRVLDQLDYTTFIKHPKWVIGYSDITAFHNQIHNLGFETIHGIMGISLDKNLEYLEENKNSLKNALFGNQLSYTIDSSNYNKLGEATGQLVGGNLTLLHTMLGSKTSIDTTNKILFFEEIGEYAYHIDRMLQSLKRAGYFENCKGIVVGDFSNVKKNSTPWGSSIEQLILDVVEEYNIPVLFNFPAGHEEKNLALILGRTVELKVKKEKSTLLFKN
ncbi:LD-carboxypeptidase [Lutibacter sp. A80]|uniref:S66 peptidase family protein n=1 Tax=Lutibacter sp. A80 TaxID=2918453 RepID=UPI001F05593D|nr:LD-carboxypeptidase [Lutibacter sp. A80]UMB61981.1 LD-carboxypeptidase [Lutibacter sp. A80]